MFSYAPMFSYGHELCPIYAHQLYVVYDLLPYVIYAHQLYVTCVHLSYVIRFFSCFSVSHLSYVSSNFYYPTLELFSDEVTFYDRLF